jgi:hypothetical protein
VRKEGAAGGDASIGELRVRLQCSILREEKLERGLGRSAGSREQGWEKKKGLVDDPQV